MWIEFKNYQEKAIVKMKQEVNELLEMEENKICIFKAPTGSGKTLMMADFLMRLADSRVDGKRFSYIWIAVNKLHDQSRDSLKKYYENKGLGLKCSYFEDLDERKIRENEILFLNWASINKKDNLYVRENERNNNLSNIVQRTKAEGRNIILIIDESHRNAETEKSKALIDEINPKITIEVSATPQLKGVFRGVEVQLNDVKDEGMIKKGIIINQDFENYRFDKKVADKTADEIVVEVGLKKRLELEKKYQEVGSSVNPLMLIQIPDSKKGLTDKKDSIIQLLTKYGITTENGKLAIYLSDKDNKINLENIEKNENEVEVMIFKQAIAVGWDCPRANILVLFREWKSMVFSIQTIGRIMRMPEHDHYKDNDLNIGYVYTSLSDIGIAEDIAKEYITVYESKRNNKIYKDIDLTSYHSKRFREETRLSSDFTPIFIKATKELKTKNKTSKKHSILSTQLIASGNIKDVDKEIKSIEKKGFIDIPKNEVELQNAFDSFVRENLDPFHPEMRSIKRVNASIYKFFGVERDEDEWPKIQAMVLAEENRQYFIDAINRAKELYQDKIGRGRKEVIKNEEPWNVPFRVKYNLNFVKKDFKKSIIEPYYSKVKNTNQDSLFDDKFEDSAQEEKFIDYLEKSKQVKWWFKNGTSDQTFFAVPYTENEMQKPFYVDFIVMLDNGKIGLFDTKGGVYAQTAKDRAEGLAKYIKEENKKGKKLFGGIVIQDKNSWRYNNQDKYSYNLNDLKDWKFLDLN
jgi:type III restriction enzyme